MKNILAGLVGLVFGIGLIISGMTDPSEVLAFLDVAGRWNPSLGLVMCGAILVGIVAFRFASRRERSLLGDAMRLPTSVQIDRRLVFGGLAFGVGWGLAGYCPGPVLATLAVGGIKPLIFFVAMVTGMGIFAMAERFHSR
ncbi:DUF6691 family protein [Janthinobacterium sp. BJB304]|uniref:YeeE/YedE family protein n=1 Tax=Janthinobacterium sp. BJB304 TaxID=1572871 RepID=UPI000C0EA33D|nr:DUF6691 family protein [Janthinobacterium sp. BJB304]PHV36004.1 transporter [Janthinobacterium sp. BJB304]